VDSGAAAFMVEQRWEARRHVPNDATAEAAGPDVVVRWNLVQLALLTVAAVASC